MNEQLLQFIWQFQYYNRTELETTGGESIKVINPGTWNHNQGPDFMDAKICINKILLAGTVEVHVQSSDWGRHHHERDRNYRNVVLHVVWEEDGHKGNLPVLELKDRVPKLLLSRYKELMTSTAFIPCEKSICAVNELTWSSWKERLLAERLISKSQWIKTCLKQNNYHWEETCWRLLARNFGIRVNAEAFESMAKTIPLRLIGRLKNELFKLEALLLGQAGLLEGKFRDEYPKQLQKEHQYQKKTYQLDMVYETPVFLRMRPKSFPTLRLAQLAVLLRRSNHLFSIIREENSLKAVKALFSVAASEYWNTHYRFDEAASHSQKKTGAALVDSIVINTIAPLLFFYGVFNEDADYKDRAIHWLQETLAENNSITEGFRELGIFIEHAFDSQALIELKTQYCDHKRCLECAVGNFLLRGTGQL
jgi:hypothetical protein